MTGRILRAKTPNDYRYGRIWATLNNNVQHLVFKVQACNDAHLALSPILGISSSKTYEVVIGGENNQRSFIRYQNLFRVFRFI